ncbi:MAG: hypothetical protein PHQ43_03180 [Dehalococcoidales bacterium]|nr:hypothetical protein [Dehalococcoidales bacterium]
MGNKKALSKQQGCKSAELFIIPGKTVRTGLTVRFSYKNGGQYEGLSIILSAKPSAAFLLRLKYIRSGI